MNTKVIDGDNTVNYELTWGRLDGWNDEGGRWKIILLTKDGWIEFQSSNPDSATAVAKVMEILRGDAGLHSPLCYIGIDSGRLVFQSPNPTAIEPDYPFDPYTHLGLATWQNEANLLAYIFGSLSELLKSIMKLHASGGVEILSEQIKIALANDVVLSWNAILDTNSLNALCAILASGVNYEWDTRGWRSMEKKFPNTIRNLLDLEFTLGPSLYEEETLEFKVFNLVSDDCLFFSDPFRLLFIDPAWATARIGTGF